jgi:hypothetical protein
VAEKFRNAASLRRPQAARIVAILMAAVWIGASAVAAQAERDAEIDRFLSRIPPVLGELEACLDADPVPGLVLVRNIREIALSRLFWRMRGRGDALNVIEDRLAVAGRQTEQMRQMAAGYLREIRADHQKLEGHCEHAAIQARALLEALR